MSSYDYSESSLVKLVLRIVTSGENLKVELPLSTTGKVIIKHLKDQQRIPTTKEDGSPQLYRIVAKESGKELAPEKSLFLQQIRDGETLLLMPIAVAGAQ